MPDINYRLISAVHDGNLERVRELLLSFGLSYSQVWAGGYILLREAIIYGHTEIAELLLRNGFKVNSESKNPSNTPLHLAVVAGNREIVEMLLDRDANINARSAHNFTALYYGILDRTIVITRLLPFWRATVCVSTGKCFKDIETFLQCEGHVNAGHNGYTPLHFAVESGRKEIVTLLLKYNAHVNAAAIHGTTPLHIAAENGYVQIAEDLLNHGAYTHSVCEEGYTPLHIASRQSSAEAIKLFLNRGADVNANTKNNLTPLHIATIAGHETVVKLLLEHRANVDAQDKDNLTPLHVATEAGHETVVKLLLEHRANVDAQNKDNLTPLHVATEAGHETVVKLLLEHTAKVDAQDKDGKTILHLAVKKGYLMIVEDVLKYSPDINNKSNKSSLNTAVRGYGEKYKKITETLLQYGLTINLEDVNNPELFHTAIEKGYLKIVEDLLKYGTDVNILLNRILKKGFTPLHNAVKNKQEEITILLINYGANVNAKDEKKQTPIFYAIGSADAKFTKLLLTNGANIKDSPELLSAAVEVECKEIIEILLQHGADINASDKYRRTALHFTALRYNRYVEWSLLNEPNIHVKGEIAALLLSKGANVNAKDKDGVTTLHVATQKGYTEVVEALLEYNADVNSVIENDITPLHLSAQNGNELITNMLLNKGADVNARQKNQITALHIASGQGHIQVVNALLEYGSDVNIISAYNYTPLEHAMCRIRSLYRPPYYCDHDYDSERYVVARSPYSYTAIDEILEQHIVKIKTAGLYVSEKNLMLTSSGNEISNFQSECEAEIKIMRGEKIDNSNTSFHDILTKSISRLAIYARNENIVRALKSDDYKTKFPIYASIINSRFRRGIEKKELLEQGSKFFHSLYESLPELTLYCTDKILSYLSDKDLRILINAM